MKITRTSTMLALATLGTAGAALYGVLAPGGDPPASPPPATAAAEPEAGNAGASATMYFTDPRGNPRNPTAAEARAAARAFNDDLRRLAGPHAGRTNVRTLPSGAVAATVATSRMSLLYAIENENGTVTVGHTTSDGDGNVPLEPTNALPEK